MREKETLNEIGNIIVKWYQKNKRILPWRESKDPYKVWISEIMLQQTRIETVKEYYKKFMEQIPNVSLLDKIEDEKLFKIWEGLGYYTRARNLKKSAKKILEDYEGKMPKTYKDLLTLPGIGEYTAGAISSICYNEPVTAVDGNVLRVISRVIASKEDILLPQTKRKITKMLQEIIPIEAGDFNEGLMEIGETICLPNVEPLCEKCPLKEICIAKEEKLTKQIPVRNKVTKRRREEKTIFVFLYQDKVAIRKRRETGLLAGLYEFPHLEQKLKEVKEEILENWQLKAISIKRLKEAKHIFSHIEWHMVGYKIEVEKENEEFLWVSKEQLREEYAIPGAFLAYKNQIE